MGQGEYDIAAAVPEVYAKLGVSRLISAAGTKTRFGGSLMRPSTLEAMRQASTALVDVEELLLAAGRRIAELTRNEAACVCSGASAGLFLSCVACMASKPSGEAGSDGFDAIQASVKNEIVMQTHHRSPYETAIHLAGGLLRYVGQAEVDRDELASAITVRTAAVVYMAGPHSMPGALPLEDVLSVCHARGVPVVVDAAAHVPPLANLWKYTGLGADLVIFSGGKSIGGPQCTGFVVGRPELITLVMHSASPFQSPGRPMKVGKEEIVGLITALESYLSINEADEIRRCEEIIEFWRLGLSEAPGVVSTERHWGDAGKPFARLLVNFREDNEGTAPALAAALRSGRPRVEVLVEAENALILDPELLTAADAEFVLRRLCEVIASLL